MHNDDRGLTLTTESAEAAAHYNETMRQYFEYRTSAGACLKQTLAADPEFVMGHCLKGYFLTLFGTVQTHDAVRKSLSAAQAGIDRVTWREAAHIKALEAWLGGDLNKTCAILDEILVEHPTDLLALKLHHFNAFWMGRSFHLRDTVAGAYAAWDEQIPGYGYVLGMLSFGLEECGEYDRAERLGRESVALNPEDLWGIHAVAHVLEMQGRLRDGMEWLDYPADAWEDRNPFKEHLWWHAALFPLESGDYDRVLALYDRSVRPDQSDFYLDIQNAASMLLRLELCGIDVGDRWRELADVAETKLDDHVLGFTEMNCMMALAADGRDAAADRLEASLAAFSNAPNNSTAATVEPAVLPLCRAVRDFAAGDYGCVVDTILPLRYQIQQVGGSHAQRDIFMQILIEAALRDGRLKLSRTLLRERLTVRPRSYGGWVRLAQTLEQLDDNRGAQSAREQADMLRAV